MTRALFEDSLHLWSLELGFTAAEEKACARDHWNKVLFVGIVSQPNQTEKEKEVPSLELRYSLFFIYFE